MEELNSSITGQNLLERIVSNLEEGDLVVARTSMFYSCPKKVLSKEKYEERGRKIRMLTGARRVDIYDDLGQVKVLDASRLIPGITLKDGRELDIFRMRSILQYLKEDTKTKTETILDIDFSENTYILNGCIDPQRRHIMEVMRDYGFGPKYDR